jgi:hypothetical protein
MENKESISSHKDIYSFLSAFAGNFRRRNRRNPTRRARLEAAREETRELLASAPQIPESKATPFIPDSVGIDVFEAIKADHARCQNRQTA